MRLREAFFAGAAGFSGWAFAFPLALAFALGAAFGTGTHFTRTSKVTVSCTLSRSVNLFPKILRDEHACTRVRTLSWHPCSACARSPLPLYISWPFFSHFTIEGAGNLNLSPGTASSSLLPLHLHTLPGSLSGCHRGPCSEPRTSRQSLVKSSHTVYHTSCIEAFYGSLS